MVDAVQALTLLVEGNRRFASGRMEGPNRGPERRAETAERQEPYAAVLTCADSRVVPVLLFDRGIGDLFVVRNAGNVLDANGLASLEIAVERCGVPLVVVLGHSRCGALRLALEGMPDRGHVRGLVAHLAPAVAAGRERAGDEWHNAVLVSVERTVAALRTDAELAERLSAGSLVVVGGFYDLVSGAVEFFAQEGDDEACRVIDRVLGSAPSTGSALGPQP